MMVVDLWTPTIIISYKTIIISYNQSFSSVLRISSVVLSTHLPVLLPSLTQAYVQAKRQDIYNIYLLRIEKQN